MRQSEKFSFQHPAGGPCLVGRSPPTVFYLDVTIVDNQAVLDTFISTVCVIEGVAGLDDEARAVNLSLESFRQQVIKPKIRSLSALTGDDPSDYALADVVGVILKRVARRLTSSG